MALFSFVLSIPETNGVSGVDSFVIPDGRKCNIQLDTVKKLDCDVTQIASRSLGSFLSTNTLSGATLRGKVF